MPKPVGGRGKRESYTTSVVRVPDPIKPQVIELIDCFHQMQPEKYDKPVTGKVRQIPLDAIAQLLEAASPIGDAKEPPLNHCEYPRDWWDKHWDGYWEKSERPLVELFNQLTDEINKCIWQIDNTFHMTSANNISTALEKLTEYGLIEPIDFVAATQRQLIDWVLVQQSHLNNFSLLISAAIKQQRWDILKALEVGEQPPVDRQSYWHVKYKELLGKPGVNYWEWKLNPESREIAIELTYLLKLAVPSEDVYRILECLPEGKDPFFKPDIKTTKIVDEGKWGKLAECDPQVKQRYRQAFGEWHRQAIAQLGKDALERIYKVIYSCNWELVEAIIYPLRGYWWEILCVRPNATPAEVKKAYRDLAKVWHPDTNSSPTAKIHMAMINKAYEASSINSYRFGNMR